MQTTDKAIPLLTLIAVLILDGTALAQADHFLVVNLSRHTKGSVTVKHTKDGVVIHTCQGDLENSSDFDVQLIVECSKPEGTNDWVTSQTSETIDVTAPIPLPSGVLSLPAGQVADLNTFLLTKGAISPESAIDFTIVTGDLNANGQRDPLDISVFGLINDLSQFSLFADVSLFPLGSSLLTEANGQVLGLPGITFFRDELFTLPYANSPLLVVGVESDFATIPEPSGFALLLTGNMLGLVSYAWRCRKRKRENQQTRQGSGRDF